MTAKITSTQHIKGPIKKFINVTTNDKENANVRLEISATVKVLIDVIPRDNLYFQVEKGNAETQFIAINSNVPGKKMEIQKVENPLTDIEVKYEPFTAKRWKELQESEQPQKIPESSQNIEKADYIVTFDISPKASVGDLTGEIKLVTNLGAKGDIQIFIRGKISGPLKLIPTFLSLGRIADVITQPIVKEFRLSHVKNEDFEIKSVTSQEKYFKSFYKKNPDKSFTITIEYEGGFPKGRPNGVIVITTDNPDQPTVELRYSGWIVGADELKEPRREPRVNIQNDSTEGSSQQPQTPKEEPK
ncbi:MAG: hypothetical protein A2161_10000 [Candidatus Schekmanbacteria bacterium RBG_13_48_7]|uniref:Uncharacterized protein n=1 Tax=Candidatus Schekmanbacteria bacterium RBG_13_48_7 TaxID=1817878 RepID=A0A1F7RZ52_9BACT|nr:MAG: hypothetical protein A2161_10000 [Candidatus Schekmanbacteria bacterium RBG_13_48_7]